MGVTLDLRVIDHEGIAVRGRDAANEAIRANDPEILRRYLATLPVEIDPAEIAMRRDRLDRLRRFNAPPLIVQNEEVHLRLATGDAYRPDAYRDASLDELCHLLGTWCWTAQSYKLDKLWEELHWFLEPVAGPDESPLMPFRPALGDPRQSVLSKAFDGSEPYPTVVSGEPVIRTLGSREPGCSGYNPPEACRVIFEALQRVDPAAWDEHLALRSNLYRRGVPGMDDEDAAEQAANDLVFARDTFPVLLAAYTKAVAKGHGISCEYSV